MTETKIVRGTIKYKTPIEKKNKLFIISLQLKNISYKNDEEWVDLQLQEYYNAAAFSEEELEYFNNFKFGDYVELKLHNKEYNGKTYWNIFSINHIEEPKSQSSLQNTEQFLDINHQKILENFPEETDINKRAKAKKIMRECKEDCEEIFGKEDIYKDGMSQHINSMFIFRTDNRRY